MVVVLDTLCASGALTAYSQTAQRGVTVRFVPAEGKPSTGGYRGGASSCELSGKWECARRGKPLQLFLRSTEARRAKAEAVTMVRARSVQVLHGFQVRLEFTDGTSRVVDLEPYLRGNVSSLCSVTRSCSGASRWTRIWGPWSGRTARTWTRTSSAGCEFQNGKSRGRVRIDDIQTGFVRSYGFSPYFRALGPDSCGPEIALLLSGPQLCRRICVVDTTNSTLSVRRISRRLFGARSSSHCHLLSVPSHTGTLAKECLTSSRVAVR